MTTKEKFKAMLEEGLNPYWRFTTEEEKALMEMRAKEYSSKYLGNVNEAFSEGTEDIGETFYADIRDDFHNCGGNPFNRLPDLMAMAPLFNEVQLEEILNKFAWAFENEWESFDLPIVSD